MRTDISGKGFPVENSSINAQHGQGAQNTPAPPAGASKPSGVSKFFGALFYLVLLAALLTAFLAKDSGDGSPRVFFGFSFFTVLTDSMSPSLPQGTFLVVRSAEPGDIKIGDDITFMRPDNSTVTHRVIETFENHTEDGQRGFRTQGVNNQRADEDIVAAHNVVGRVVFSSPLAGLVLDVARKHPLACASMVLMALALFAALRYLARTLVGRRGEG